MVGAHLYLIFHQELAKVLTVRHPDYAVLELEHNTFLDASTAFDRASLYLPFLKSCSQMTIHRVSFGLRSLAPGQQATAEAVGLWHQGHTTFGRLTATCPYSLRSIQWNLERYGEFVLDD